MTPSHVETHPGSKEAFQRRRLLAKSDDAELWLGAYHGAKAVLRRVRGDAAAAVLDEVAALTDLARTGLPSVLAAWREGDEAFVVREWIEGSDLQSEERLDEEEVAAVVLDLAGALASVHEAGYVHLDVSAANVVRTPDGRTLPLDFGLASRSGAVFDTTRGTAYYVAPEVILGLAADGRADLFSLGVLMVRLLTGPFEETPESFYSRFPWDHFLRAARIDAERIPARLRPIVLALLAPEAGARIESARALCGHVARAYPELARERGLDARPRSVRVDRALWRGAALTGLWSEWDQALRGEPAARRLRVVCGEPSAVAEIARDAVQHARLSGAVTIQLAPGGGVLRRAAALVADAGLPARQAPSVVDLAPSEATLVLARWCAAALADAADDSPLAVLLPIQPDDAAGRAFAAALTAEWDHAPAVEKPLVALEVRTAPAGESGSIWIPGPKVATLAAALRQSGFAGTDASLAETAERALEAAGADAHAVEEVLTAALQQGKLLFDEGGFRLAGDLPVWNEESSARSLSPGAVKAGVALSLMGGEATRSFVAFAAKLGAAEFGAALAELIELRRVRAESGERRGALRLTSAASGRALEAAAPADVKRSIAARVLKEGLPRTGRDAQRAHAAAVAGDAQAAIEAALALAPELRRGAAADEALRVFDEVAAVAGPTTPGAAKLYKHRAEVRIAAGEFDGAAEDAALAATGGGDAALEASVLRAEIAFRSGDARGAIARLDAAHLPPPAPAELHSRAAQILASAWLALGDHGRAASVLDAALARGGWNAAELTRLHLPRSVSAMRAGDAELASREAAAALEAARSADDLAAAASALVNMGFAREQLGDADGAVAALREARDLFRRLRRWVGEANAAHHLGLALRRAGERDEAEIVLREALAIRMRLRDAHGTAVTRGSLAALFAERGEFARASAELAETASAFERLGAKREHALALTRLASALLESGRATAAAAEIDTALALQESLGLPAELAESRLLKAKIKLALGARREAERACAELPPSAARTSLAVECMLEHGAFEEAADAARGLIEKHGRAPVVADGAVNLTIGEAEFGLSRFAAAVEACEAAIHRSRPRKARYVTVRALVLASLSARRAGDARRASALEGEATLELDQIRLAEGTDRRWEDVLGMRLTRFAQEFSESPARGRNTMNDTLQSFNSSGGQSGSIAAREPSARQGGAVSDELLRAFLAINKRLNTATDREQLLRFILDSAIGLTGARRGFLAIFRGDALEIELASSVDRATMPTPTRELSKSIVKEAVATGRPILTSNARADSRFSSQQSVAALDLRSIACVPFRTEDGLSGALYLDNPLREGAFTERTIDLLDALADQSAIALTHWLRREQIQRLNDQLSDRLREKERALAAAEREIETTRRRLEPVGFVATSRAMAEVLSVVDRVAAADVPILLLGESGTGKDVLAHEIHRRSSRAGARMVSHNCAATPESLLESEFFGHVRGAFTGAERDRTGLVELAHRGTLFLDEVGDLPLTLQAKLLRFLQDGEFRPVGAREMRRSDVRVLSATNRRLDDAVRAGTFREDLLYRLRGVVITLPPLRDRREDIVPLADAFLERLNQQHGTHKKLSVQVARALERLEWRGNIRELEHEVARLYYLCSGDLDAESLLAQRSLEGVKPGPGAAATVRPISELERDAIIHALHQFDGNREQAAKALGISRTTIYEKIKTFGLSGRNKSAPQ